ncbi:MAG: histidine phosphatase family protein [Candidatus Aenigmarchaeota archaeon]|nr:histidine phosphatase family protein [Candidatus Aenigmarchaeota archaeon]
MEIYIVRHGESVANDEWRLPTRDTPLTERGVKQAQTITEYLAGRVELIYSSPLTRAYQTAEIIGNGLGCPVVKMWDLRDMGYGELAGREYFDKRARRALRKAGPENPKYRIRGGGSFQGLQRRSDRALQRILKSGKNSVASVSHLETNRILIARLLGRGLEDIHDVEQPNDLVYLFDTATNSLQNIMDGNVEDGLW